MKQVYAIPILIAVVTAFGLVAALWGGAPWHAASWIALATPIVAVIWKISR